MRLRRHRDQMPVRAFQPSAEHAAALGRRTRGRAAVVVRDRDVDPVHVHHRLGRGDIHDLSVSVAVAHDQRGPGRERQRGAAVRLVHLRPGHQRRARVRAQVASHARRRAGGVRPRQRGRGPLGRAADQTERRHRGDDQLRMTRVQVVRVEVERRQLVGRPIGDEDVGLGDQLVQHPATSGRFEIQHQTALGGVVGQPRRRGLAVRRRLRERRHLASGVARRRFDLDRLRARVGEQLGGERTGDLLGQLDDPHAVEQRRAERWFCADGSSGVASHSQTV